MKSAILFVRSSWLAGVLLAGLGLLGNARADESTQTADETALREAGLNVNAEAMLRFFRVRTLSEADQSRLTATVRRLGDSVFTVRENATQELIAVDRPALPFLRPALKDADLEIARRARRCIESIESGSGAALELAAARVLAGLKPVGAVEVVLNYLPFADSAETEEELLTTLAAVGLRNGQADPRLASALSDSMSARRSAAAWVLGRSPQAEQRASVKPLLSDPDSKVRLRAAQGLVAGRDKDAVPALVALLGTAPVPVAWQAEELLCLLAGEQAPPVSVGSGAEADRLKSREAWDAWWRAEGPKLDLAHLDMEKRLLGLTLIVAFDGFGTTGKVWETRLDHRPRWEIGNLQGPINASMVSANRVLIAEHNGKRVTERDLKGNIVWQHQIANNQYPIACQRLPNGNTFIATYNQVLEVTTGGKQVYSYPCTQGIIYSAQKRPDGRIAYVTSNGKLVELDEKGKELRSITLGPNAGWVTVETLPRGRFLVPQPAAGKVLELNEAGKTVVTYDVPNANAATKLPNGNILVCRHNDRTVAEVNRAGKVIWEQRLEGRPFWVHRR